LAIVLYLSIKAPIAKPITPPAILLDKKKPKTANPIENKIFIF